MKNRKGLVDHINDSINLYTAFGIFNALMLFALGTESKIGNFLAQNFMWITVILWVIIRQRIPRARNAVINLYRLIFDWVFVALFFLFYTIKSLEISGLNTAVLSAFSTFIFAPAVHLALLKRQKTRGYFVPNPAPGIATIYFGILGISFMIISRFEMNFKTKIGSATDEQILIWIFMGVLVFHLFRIAIAHKNDQS